jgi:hypothetical protein
MSGRIGRQVNAPDWERGLKYAPKADLRLAKQLRALFPMAIFDFGGIPCRLQYVAWYFRTADGREHGNAFDLRVGHGLRDKDPRAIAWLIGDDLMQAARGLMT